MSANHCELTTDDKIMLAIFPFPFITPGNKNQAAIVQKADLITDKAALAEKQITGNGL
jgi:hypothetical protein